MPGEKSRGRGKRKATGHRRNETIELDIDAVRSWREKRGFTQRSLAAQKLELDDNTVGISYAEIRRIEKHGRARPSTARILAALLAVDLNVLRPADPLLCGTPRALSQAFVGREATLEKLAALVTKPSRRVMLAVEGQAGIGKTELALQLASRLETEGTFRIFWLDAENPDLRPIWGGPIATQLGIGDDTLGARVQRVLDKISSWRDQILIVLDNATEWSAATPWPRPRGTHIRWLLTTRVHQLGHRELRHIELDVLDAQAARELMTRISPRIAKRPGFVELVAYLDGYPIALELAASFLERFSEWTPADYLDALRSAKGRQLQERAQDTTLYGITLEHAFDLLWRQLPAATRRHWARAASFADASAGRELSDAAGLNLKARDQLRQLHLIAEQKDGRWSMHRLTRAYGRAAGTDEERIHARAAFVRGCVERGRAIEMQNAFETYLPDRAHFDAAEELLRNDPPLVEAKERSILFDKIGLALHGLGELVRAREVLESVLASDLRDLGEQHPSIAEHRSTLAMVLKDLGELRRAKELMELALASDLRNLGEDDPTVSTRRANLGVLLRYLGEPKLAKEQQEAALASSLRTLGEDHEQVTICRSNLALVLQDLGEFGRARELLETTLASTLRSTSEDHPSVVTRRSNLGVFLRHLGEPKRAKELLEAALASALRTVGEDHPSVTVGRSNLSLVLKDLGELHRAKEMVELALASNLRSLGEDHPDVPTRRSNLGLILQDLGELESAKVLLEAALASTLKGLGEEHPSVAFRRSNLAMVLRDLGEPGRAKDLLETALASDLKNFGQDHPRVAERRANLAMVLKDLGELGRARELLETALASDLQSLGQDHPTVAKRRSSLASVLHELGELGRAKDLLDAALASDLKRLGEDHPSVAACRSSLALLLMDLGETATAQDHAREALRVARLQTAGSLVRQRVERVLKELALS